MLAENKEITKIIIPNTMTREIAHRINTLDNRLKRGTVSKKSRFSGMVNKVAAIVAVKVPVIYRKNV
jgi:hypothetical protein